MTGARRARSKVFNLVINPADKAISLYVRYRDKWTCQRCQTVHAVGSGGLQNSHYFGRAVLATRYDLENCDALCGACHRFWGSDNRENYRTFKIRQLGQTRFDALQVRANTIVKRASIDVSLIAKGFRELLRRDFNVIPRGVRGPVLSSFTPAPGDW